MPMIRAVALHLCLAVGAASAAEEPVLNIYNWSDYIAPDTIERFEQETGIDVRYDVFDSNETVEAKLLAGSTGYDIVVPSASFVARQIAAGIFQPLDRARLTNYGNLEPGIMKTLAGYDPGNAHVVPWLWGTTGIGYNVAKIRERMPDAPIGSWDLLLNPEVVSRFADCGVTLLDAPAEVVPSLRRWLALPTDAQDAAGLEGVMKALGAVRPHVRYFHSSQYINDLANGEVCLSMGWSGDVLIARDRAAEAANGQEIAYFIPKEGALVWFDVMAIPKDAPHPDNAHRFIDFVLRPEVIAAVSNYVNYANANAAATPLVDASVRNDPAIYPDDATRAQLFPNVVNEPGYERSVTRAWTRLKTGR